MPLPLILISILFHHYKEFKECISEVGQIDASRATDNSSSTKKTDWFTIKEEKGEEMKEQKEEMPPTTTLDD